MSPDHARAAEAAEGFIEGEDEAIFVGCLAKPGEQASSEHFEAILRPDRRDENARRLRIDLRLHCAKIVRSEDRDVVVAFEPAARVGRGSRADDQTTPLWAINEPLIAPDCFDSHLPRFGLRRQEECSVAERDIQELCDE